MQNQSQVIRTQADLLMLLNGKTTTLEVKNAIYLVNPNCGLTQSEASTEMIAYEAEKAGEIVSVLETNPVPHRVYSFATVAQKAPIVATQVPKTDFVASAIQAVAADKAKKTTVKATSVVTGAGTSGNNVIVGKVNLYDEAFLAKLDKGIFIAYSASKEPVLTPEKDKNNARRLFKTMTGEKHNDVRMMTLKRYMSILKKEQKAVGYNPAS